MNILLCKLELTALTRTPSVQENNLHVRYFVQPVSCRSGRQEVYQSMTSFAKFGACLEIADSLLWQRDGDQPAADEDQNEQQQQQPANHSSHTAEIARCRMITPFSHPGLDITCKNE